MTSRIITRFTILLEVRGHVGRNFLLHRCVTARACACLCTCLPAAPAFSKRNMDTFLRPGSCFAKSPCPVSAHLYRSRGTHSHPARTGRGRAAFTHAPTHPTSRFFVCVGGAASLTKLLATFCDFFPTHDGLAYRFALCTPCGCGCRCHQSTCFRTHAPRHYFSAWGTLLLSSKCR